MQVICFVVAAIKMCKKMIVFKFSSANEKVYLSVTVNTLNL